MKNLNTVNIVCSTNIDDIINVISGSGLAGKCFQRNLLAVASLTRNYTKFDVSNFNPAGLKTESAVIEIYVISVADMAEAKKDGKTAEYKTTRVNITQDGDDLTGAFVEPRVIVATGADERTLKFSDYPSDRDLYSVVASIVSEEAAI